MYNEIGLATVRGSATSGYVQRNLSCIRRTRRDADFQREYEPHKKTSPAVVSKDLLTHKVLREIDVQMIEFQDDLEAKGLSPSEVQELVLRERNSRLEAVKQKIKDEGIDAVAADSLGIGGNPEQQVSSLAKNNPLDALSADARNEKMKRVLGIDRLERNRERRKKAEEAQERQKQARIERAAREKEDEIKREAERAKREVEEEEARRLAAIKAEEERLESERLPKSRPSSRDRDRRRRRDDSRRARKSRRSSRSRSPRRRSNSRRKRRRVRRHRDEYRGRDDLREDRRKDAEEEVRNDVSEKIDEVTRNDTQPALSSELPNTSEDVDEIPPWRRFVEENQGC